MMDAQIIELPKRPGRHMAHRADRFGHPAYRQVAAYFDARVVDEYQPRHRKPVIFPTWPRDRDDNWSDPRDW